MDILVKKYPSINNNKYFSKLNNIQNDKDVFFLINKEGNSLYINADVNYTIKHMASFRIETLKDFTKILKGMRPLLGFNSFKFNLLINHNGTSTIISRARSKNVIWVQRNESPIFSSLLQNIILDISQKMGNDNK